MSANGRGKKMVADNPRRTDIPDNTFSIFETFNFMVFTPEIHILDYSLIIAKLLLTSVISCEERMSKRRREEAFFLVGQVAWLLCHAYLWSCE